MEQEEGDYWDDGAAIGEDAVFPEDANTDVQNELYDNSGIIDSAEPHEEGDDGPNNPDGVEEQEPKKKKKRTKEEKAERKKRKKEKRERKRKEKERRAKELGGRRRRKHQRGEGGTEMEDELIEGENHPEEGDRPLKKKRKQEMTESEASENVRCMLDRMAAAADEDDLALSNRQPAFSKLSFLDTICVEIPKPKWVNWYIREGVCHLLGRWLAPLPGGGLPNITIRTKILKLMQKMPLYVEHLQGTTLGIRLIAMWNSSEELEENRLCIRDIVQSLMRPLFGIRWSQRQNDEMMDDISIPKAQIERPGVTGEPSRRARIPVNTGYSFKVQPKSQFKGTQNETTRDGESTMARLSRMMAYKKTFGNRTATRAQNVSVSKSVM